MELKFPEKKQKVVLLAGVLSLILVVLTVIFWPKKTDAHSFTAEEKSDFNVLSVFTKKVKIIQPVPSAELTPLPTFTPTPTNTPTPTPTPTNTPTPTLTPTPTIYIPPPAPEEIDRYFKQYAQEFNIEENKLRKIAACESGYNTSSLNTAYDYAGMFQFGRVTWEVTRQQMSADTNPDLRFSAEESIKTAAFKIAHGGEGAWPNCK